MLIFNWMYMFGYAPEPLDVNEQFELNRQHAIEWQTMLALESESRCALKNRHRYERQQARLNNISFDEATLLNHHQQQWLALDQKHQQEQVFIHTCQAAETAALAAQSQRVVERKNVYTADLMAART